MYREGLRRDYGEVISLMLRRWDNPTNPPWDGGGFRGEEVVEADNQRKRMKVRAFSLFPME